MKLETFLKYLIRILHSSEKYSIAISIKFDWLELKFFFSICLKTVQKLNNIAKF